MGSDVWERKRWEGILFLFFTFFLSTLRFVFLSKQIALRGGPFSARDDPLLCDIEEMDRPTPIQARAVIRQSRCFYLFEESPKGPDKHTSAVPHSDAGLMVSSRCQA